MATLLAVSDLQGGENATLFEGQDHGSTVSSFLVHASPGGGPGLHHHPYEETFIVQEGSVTFTADDETIEAVAGQIVVVPAGAAHAFVNSGEDVLRMVTIHPSDHVIQEWLEEE